MAKQLFKVRGRSHVPKYQQIVDGVVGAIRDGRARVGDVMPSVSFLCKEFGLARETVLRAYAELKGMGIVNAVPRKGYFVATESVAHAIKVMLLFDEFSAYKQDLYVAFREQIGDRALVDISFHHCDIRAFKALLLSKCDDYSLCVVMPFSDASIPDILRLVDPAKLLMFERLDYVGKKYSFIGQDHDESLFDALESGRDLFRKYSSICLAMPRPDKLGIPSQAPPCIPDAFRRFCRKNRFKHSVIRNVSTVKKGEAYLVIDDADLLTVVEQTRERGLRLGRDIGVLAYNETDLRRITVGGITVVSTDFREMGRRAAKYALSPSKTWDIVPTRMIRRSSL